MKSSTDTSCAGRRSGPWKIPAAVTTPEIRPRSSCGGATAPATCASSATSHGYADAVPPAARIIAAVSSALSRCRSTTATAAPSRAARLARRPPDPAPSAGDDDRPPGESSAASSLIPRSVPSGLSVGSTWMSAYCHDPAPQRATMHSVAGKVVIITGSGQGIGEGMALHLGKGGARVVVAEWKDDLMVETCRELDELGIANHRRRVRHPAARPRSTRWSRRRSNGSVASTGSINNAQTFRPLAPIADVTEHDVDVFYDSGVKGTLWAMQAVYPHMRRAGLGSHRQLRVVDGHHRRRRASRRTTRRRRRSAR